MHDPSSVAFEIRYPWRAYSRAHREAHPKSEFTQTYRRSFITIWHEDPETDGSDDSCDWFGSRRPLNPRERALYEAMDDLFHKLGNTPYYPDPKLWGKEPHGEDPSGWGVVTNAQRAMYAWRRRSSFRWHPRWHFWHWRIQVHPYQQARRWLLTRCCKCGGRFAYGESPVTGSWDSKPPRLFRGEQGLWHMDCDRPGNDGAAQEAKAA
jgi:hypothetical protein